MENINSDESASSQENKSVLKANICSLFMEFLGNFWNSDGDSARNWKVIQRSKFIFFVYWADSIKLTTGWLTIKYFLDISFLLTAFVRTTWTSYHTYVVAVECWSSRAHQSLRIKQISQSIWMPAIQFIFSKFWQILFFWKTLTFARIRWHFWSNSRS